MLLTINKLTALRVVRSLRSKRGRIIGQPCDLIAPSPAPHLRWTWSALPHARLALPSGANKIQIDVAVPSEKARIQASFVSNTIHSTGLPSDAFVDLGGGLSIPCPELLFVELAAVMTTPALALVGCELCGSFSRDPHDPRMGIVAESIPPATSVERINRFIDLCHIPGKDTAKRVVDYVADNAWSPMEAVVAVMAMLPAGELGYGLGRVMLNSRHENAPELVELGVAETRVPDIEIPGTYVGFNYDGGGHLDLEGVANAAAADKASPMIHRVREKYVDDLRRNRELVSQGRLILPITREDLFREGGLDTVMLEAALASESMGETSLAGLRKVVGARRIRHQRQEMIWSLLPWDAGKKYSHRVVERQSGRTEPVAIVDGEINETAHNNQVHQK